MRSVDKAMVLMVGRAFSSSTLLLISILLARSLSKEDYGTYVQVSMLIQLCGLALTLGIPSSITYFLPKAVDRGRLIVRSYLLMLAAGVVGACCLLLARDQVSLFFNNPKLAAYAGYAAAGLLFFLASQLTRPILMNLKNPLLLAKVETLRSVLFVAAMALSALYAPRLPVVVGILAASFCFDAAVSIAVITRAARRYREDRDQELAIGRQLKYSFPLGSLALCWYFGRELDKYVISHYMRTEDLALYSRGAIELPLVHILASTVSQLKLPDWVAQWDKGSNRSLLMGWHDTVVKAALVIFPAFVLLEFLGKDFIALLYSDKYLQSAEVFHVYLLMLPLQITSYTAIIESTGRNKLVLIGYLVQLPFSVVLSACSIKLWGWYGPALVSVVGLYAWTAYLLILISKIFKVPFGQVFPWRHLAKILLICAVSSLAPALVMLGNPTAGLADLPRKEIGHAVNILLYSLVFALAYVTLSVRCSVLKGEDADTLRRWLLVNRVKRIFGRQPV